jgi:hypothetical protein
MFYRRFPDPAKLAENAQSEEEALKHYPDMRDEIGSFVEKLPEMLEKGVACPHDRSVGNVVEHPAVRKVVEATRRLLRNAMLSGKRGTIIGDSGVVRQALSSPRAGRACPCKCPAIY